MTVTVQTASEQNELLCMLFARVGHNILKIGASRQTHKWLGATTTPIESGKDIVVHSLPSTHPCDIRRSVATSNYLLRRRQEQEICASILGTNFGPHAS